MKISTRKMAPLVLAGLATLGLAGGCGGPSGMPAGQAELFGKVTKNGKPLIGGGSTIYKMILEPVGGPAPDGRVLDAQLSEDGSYSITLPQGEYNIRVMNAKSEPVGQQVTVNASESLSMRDIEVEKKKP